MVTGGAGFIGSHLADALVAAGRPVRVLDDFSTGQRDNLAPGVEVIEGSVTDPAAVARAVEGCEVVFHLAALASVAKSVENPGLTHEVCATGTLNVREVLSWGAEEYRAALKGSAMKRVKLPVLQRNAAIVRRNSGAG